jgi:hypothetical protein
MLLSMAAVNLRFAVQLHIAATLVYFGSREGSQNNVPVPVMTANPKRP